MTLFWCTSETIPDGYGFAHYSPLHLVWLGVFVAAVILNGLLYRRLSNAGQTIWRRCVACLLIADELFKVIPMLITGTYGPDYLPFHLCSINIFMIAVHAWRPGRVLDNFLYTICIPGALAALLFPTWTKLPAANFMCIHSFTVHILLALYPIVLTVCGQIRPDVRLLPRCFALLGGFAGVALVLNLLLDTNFMFLMHADAGNPLALFETWWGSHLWGFPVIIFAVVVVMHTPWILARRYKKSATK